MRNLVTYFTLYCAFLFFLFFHLAANCYVIPTGIGRLQHGMSVVRSPTLRKALPAGRLSRDTNPSKGHISATAQTDAACVEISEWKGAQMTSALTKNAALKEFDIEAIKQILPHRFPFLLVDKVLEFEPGVRAVGIKQVTSNEDQFNGHFPSRAVMPGVLQVEALAQLCGIIALQKPVSNGQGNFFFAGVDGVKWKKPVVPGDTLVMEAELLSWKPKFGIAKMAGRAYVDGQLAIDVKEMTFALVK
eukprot:GHVT01067491.1.p3 GENE.GHVT01067491.1~~GHVT01067491.1.p3  ORF type:complete len:246 (+),score=19.95 GHVT01067491.1:9511-10248(+)